MPIDWKDAEVKDRLLAAIIASFDGKINCREVARLFGGGATYNAIENFLRAPKKKALELKAQASDSPAASPAKPRTPKKAGGGLAGGDGVKSGRITKSTPKKANGGKSVSGSPIKKELDLENGDEVFNFDVQRGVAEELDHMEDEYAI